MQNITENHLRRWLDHQFSELDRAHRWDLLEAMRETYARDPEFYDNAGWWRVYEHSDK